MQQAFPSLPRYSQLHKASTIHADGAARADAVEQRAQRRREEQQRVDKMVCSAHRTGFDGGLIAGYRRGWYWGLFFGAAIGAALVYVGVAS